MATTETRNDVTQPATIAGSPSLPVLPGAGSGADPDALKALRRFFVDPGAEPGGVPEGTLPALLAPMRDAVAAEAGRPSRLRTGEPFFVGPSEGGALALELPDLLERLAPEEGTGRLLRDNLRRLERRVRRRAADLAAPGQARELLEAAGRDLAGELDLAEGDREALEGSLETLLSDVPPGSRFVPFTADVPVHLLAAAVGERQAAARQAFGAEVTECRVILDRMLEGSRAGSGGEDLGEMGSRFLDASALAGVTGRRKGGKGLPEERRQRLEEARETLEEFGAAAAGMVLVIDPRDGVPEVGGSGDAFRLDESDDPCGRAAEIYDREAERLARTVAAARVARLADEGTYDPERHDPWLARLGWRDLDLDELALLPVVAARVSADRTAREGLLSLSRLLLSGRTVQVLMTVDPAGNPGAGDAETGGAESGAADAGGTELAGYRLDPGYLGLGHREAFVQQGNAARPARLMDGFRRALASGRTGFHAVAVPRPMSPEEALEASARALGWLAAGAALESRAHPSFLYDPEAGASWARRLDFSGNPEPEEDWPTRRLDCRTAAGAEESLEVAFTFADYALLAPELGGHFRPVPEGVPEAELVPLADHLETPARQAPQGLPFVWGVDGEGKMSRLVVSRPLALACRDRLDLWRTLRELAGIKSEYVREATAQVRREMEERLEEERMRLQAEHAEELERVRQRAAEEVADRLTAALLEVDVSTFAGSTLAGAAAASSGAPGAGLALGAGGAFAGGDADQVAARLLEWVRPESLEAEAGDGSGASRSERSPSGASSSEVDRVAAELLDMVGPLEPAVIIEEGSNED